MVDTSATMQEHLRALHDLENSRDFAALEEIATRFNIFDVLGVKRKESAHTRFLGFLLNPKKRHGLGDRFLKRFLQIASENSPEAAHAKPSDINDFDFSQADVRVEGRNEDAQIDILIRDAKNGINVIVENKIDSKQHSNQLSKYYNREVRHYPKRRIVGVYLTKDAVESGHEHYVPFAHKQIRDLTMELLGDPDLPLASEFQCALKQYSDAIRRHLMVDEESEELCMKLYMRHKHAIDEIIKCNPSLDALAYRKLKELVEAEPTLELDSIEKNKCVRFMPKSIDRDYFKCGSERESRRVVLFEFTIAKSVNLFIEMGPGRSEEVRKHIHDFASAYGEPFQFERKLGPKWRCLFKERIIDRLDDDLDPNQLIHTIKCRWDQFLRDDLPRIEQAFLGHQWPTS